MITSLVKSKQKPDENIATIIEIDIQSSLLPFVIPGMQTVLAKQAYSDADGRLLIPKIFRAYVRNGVDQMGIDDEDTDAEGDYGDQSTGRPHTQRRKDPLGDDGQGRLHPAVVESVLTSELDEDFALDREQIEQEFGVRLTDADIRRAIRRIGDVRMVDKVRMVKRTDQILNQLEYAALRKFIKAYFGDEKGSKFDFLFQWDASDPVATGLDSNQATPDIQDPKNQPLLNGRHHPLVTFTKWKNVMFETESKMADFVVDQRRVRICGSEHQSKKRVRSAALFEFSTDGSINSGAHTAGSYTERASSSRSSHPREFAEALFFLTVDFNWDLLSAEEQDELAVGALPKAFYLTYCHPMTVRREDSLTIVGREPQPRSSTKAGDARARKYKKKRWIDVDDMVDIVGLLYCRQEEYICWRDGSWDPVDRSTKHPLIWRFRPDPSIDTVQQPSVSGSAQGNKTNTSSDGNFMRDWTPDSSNRVRDNVSSRFEPDLDAGWDDSEPDLFGVREYAPVGQLPEEEEEEEEDEGSVLVDEGDWLVGGRVDPHPPPDDLFE